MRRLRDSRVLEPLEMVLELSVLLLCAGMACINKWVVRTVLWGTADRLLAYWIQMVGVVYSLRRET